MVAEVEGEELAMDLKFVGKSFRVVAATSAEKAEWVAKLQDTTKVGWLAFGGLAFAHLPCARD